MFPPAVRLFFFFWLHFFGTISKGHKLKHFSTFRIKRQNYSLQKKSRVEAKDKDINDFDRDWVLLIFIENMNEHSSIRRIYSTTQKF